MEYFKIHRYNDCLYQICDPLGVLITLVIGKDKALVFDTGYGIGDLKQCIAKITSKELIVVASHGHFDHTGGNYQFREVMISKKDYDLCVAYNREKWRKRNIARAEALNVLPCGFDIDKYLTRREGNLVPLDMTRTIDLGGITCKPIALPGHTQGSIGIFIKEEKLFLASDAICPVVWLFLGESTSVSLYKETVKRALKLDFTHFLVGHGAKMYSKKDMEKFLAAAEDVDLKKATRISYQDFTEFDSYIFLADDKTCGVVFTPEKNGW